MKSISNLTLCHYEHQRGVSISPLPVGGLIQEGDSSPASDAGLGMTASPRGFTLIELLIVVAIIGVLTSFLVANFIGVKQRSRDAQRKSDLRNIQAALEIYRSDKGSYPPNSGSDSFPSTCGSEFKIGGTVYMQKIPCDPLSDPLNLTTPFTYLYKYTTVTKGYTLIACLENANDSQGDSSNNPRCTGGSVSYTLSNP